MYNFLNSYLISVVSYMFRTPWVHSQVWYVFTCLGVSSLVGRRKRWKGKVTFGGEDKCLQGFGEES
jgi:polyisoprenoid-binding protein YceI